ncbi:sigma-70 family RNA polymerase sigma factor [Microbulbifer agarilyticus]|uniref:sigma-70 family RNA polymerase sigma factor n=1 Tax=Microbulbifer agarilyticus TaxID=260552 RepID=UPI001CD3A008|nr:sigma-70 family RNA polymerase sigma factor [Microbulbifer agarilyticus]MCA0900936.1 sigma-70 family RNA polymerase sigma factor [Microbulbifer agarilyticus]
MAVNYINRGSAATVQASEKTRDDEWSNLLVRVGRERDRASFEQLFSHFAPLIRGFQFSRGGQSSAPEAADELIQEVMFRVWTKAPTFNPGKASASTWVFTIMRNCRIDALRRNSRQPVTDESLSVEDIWDDSQDEQPLVFLQQSRNQSAIAQGLQSLPPEQSHVIEKAYVEGKSHSEISEELGLPLGTVKSRVRLALKKLQSTLVR